MESDIIEPQFPMVSRHRPAQAEIKDARLLWSGWIEGERRPRGDLIEKFIECAYAPALYIRGFALRHGILGICKHGLPCGESHPPPANAEPCQPLGWDIRKPGGWEPIAAWRHYARVARAVVRIAERVRDGQPGSPEDVAAALMPVQAPETWDENAPRPPWLRRYDSVIRPSLALHRELVASSVRGWLLIAGVRPRFVWNDLPRIDFECPTLFGILAVQLALAVAGSSGFQVCGSCGAVYMPRRRPRAFERNYCEDCRKQGIPIRDAMRSYRARIAGSDGLKQSAQASKTGAILGAKLSPKPTKKHGKTRRA